MQQIFVYGDSLTWGIIPNTRRRLPFESRWPGVMEGELTAAGHAVRVLEDALNGRRTVWDDPFKPGRNGLVGLEQRMEIHSPLALVMVMLGTNDFQSMHAHNAWHSAQGLAALVRAIRHAPIEPGMPSPEILLMAPPSICGPTGPMAPKFQGGDARCVGLADAIAQVASDERCRFFDTAAVTCVSPLDGVHLDAEQHAALGRALAPIAAAVLTSSRPAGPPS